MKAIMICIPLTDRPPEGVLKEVNRELEGLLQCQGAAYSRIDSSIVEMEGKEVDYFEYLFQEMLCEPELHR